MFVWTWQLDTARAAAGTSTPELLRLSYGKQRQLHCDDLHSRVLLGNPHLTTQIQTHIYI